MDTTQKVDPEVDGKQPVPTTNQTVQDTAPSQEELEWNKLSGNAQQRFLRVLKERDELKKQIGVNQMPQYIPPVPVVQPQISDPNAITDEQKLAVQRMRQKYGFVTQEDIEAERGTVLAELQKVQDKMVLDNEYSRLKSIYDGRDGRPAFEESEIEEHMRVTGIYNPEKAYEDLYKDELFDWKVSHNSKGNTSEKKQTFSEKPNAQVASKSETLTVDSLRERLAKPDGQKWWEENRERLLPLLPQLMGQS